jgi:chemotaxis protein methyltransferase CheR
VTGLDRLAKLVHAASGIVLKPSQYPSLRAALGRALPGVDAESFLHRAGRERELVGRLLDEVTVKETFFMRDHRQLDGIDWQRLRQSAADSGSAFVRIWSAGCSTGEEPYTLAMLAYEAFAAWPPPVRILATDISQAALEAAAAGRYRRRAVQEVNHGLVERFFERDGADYVLDERVRAVVELRQHNLAADPVPPLGTGPFDLIVCRNVFIYFDAPLIEATIERFERALAPHGMLLLGAADAISGPVRRPPPPRREPRKDAALRRAPRPAAPQPLPAAPLDADGYFLRGLEELESGRPAEAVESLRRALYVDPAFALAAFTLGRAHDALGDLAAARRSYQQALRTLEGSDERHEEILQQVDLGDVAAACRARLAALR